MSHQKSRLNLNSNHHVLFTQHTWLASGSLQACIVLGKLAPHFVASDLPALAPAGAPTISCAKPLGLVLLSACMHTHDALQIPRQLRHVACALLLSPYKAADENRAAEFNCNASYASVRAHHQSARAVEHTVHANTINHRRLSIG